MTVSPLDFSTSWILPGCGVACVPRRHDPVTHELHGFRLALMAQTVKPTRIVRTGPLVVDLVGRHVAVRGVVVPLTGREWGLLSFLAVRAGRFCANDEIVADVWGPEYVTGEVRRSKSGRMTRVDHRVLTTNLSRLREKLGPAGPLIVTVYGTVAGQGGKRLELVAPESAS